MSPGRGLEIANDSTLLQMAVGCNGPILRHMKNDYREGIHFKKTAASGGRVRTSEYGRPWAG
jgi:hypothetical protein